MFKMADRERNIFDELQEILKSKSSEFKNDLSKIQTELTEIQKSFDLWYVEQNPIIRAKMYERLNSLYTNLKINFSKLVDSPIITKIENFGDYENGKIRWQHLENICPPDTPIPPPVSRSTKPKQPRSLASRAKNVFKRTHLS